MANTRIEMTVPLNVIVYWPEHVPIVEDAKSFETDVSMCKPGATETIWARVYTEASDLDVEIDSTPHQDALKGDK
jgi:hypothetical protein